MVSLKFIELAALAAAFANAAPSTSFETAGNATHAIAKRADIRPVSCGVTPPNVKSWPLESVQAAYDGLVSYGRMPKPNQPKAGTRRYPQQFGDPTPSDTSIVNALDAIEGCQTGQTGYKYFEFPITNPAFTGGAQGSQGPDRVLAISPAIGQGGTRQYTYCLSMTHRDETEEGDYDPCTVAT